jgi:hypothetical protein
VNGDQVVRIDSLSPFTLARDPSLELLSTEGLVRYLVLSGKQDDELYGPIGALWLSEDGERGGFLVSQWALWEGSEFVRGYRGALRRGWTPRSIYEYWRDEVWPGLYTIDEEREADTLLLLHELVTAL